MPLLPFISERERLVRVGTRSPFDQRRIRCLHARHYLPFTLMSMSCCRSAKVLMDIVAPSGPRPPTTGQSVPSRESVYVRFSEGTTAVCLLRDCGTDFEHLSKIGLEFYQRPFPARSSELSGRVRRWCH